MPLRFTGRRRRGGKPPYEPDDGDRTYVSSDYDFYDGTPPHEHVDTSEWAADDILEHAAHQRRLVWQYMYGRGEDGSTDDEGEIALELRHQSFSARRRELILCGLVVETKQKRLTTSGRWARVRVCREFAPAGEDERAAS